MRKYVTLPALGVIVTAFMLGMALVSCTGEANASNPASTIDGTKTQVIRMPDGFRNVAFTCHGLTGVYVTAHQGSQSSTDVAVVINDPKCSR
jgi:hypothetical protein